MNEAKMREELYSFYLQGDAERAKSFADKCFSILNGRVTENMSVTAQKLLQYDVISDEFEPVVFRHNAFFYETGVLTSLSDGAIYARGHNFCQANGWTYRRNEHIFAEQDQELFRITNIQKGEQLYLICGPYNDFHQHFNYNYLPYLKKGLKGVYEQAQKELENAKTDDEREYLNAVCHGMLCLRKMAEKFAKKAEEMLKLEKDEQCKINLSLVAETAKRVPWEAPKTLYEALATLAFLRTTMGSLEGAGPNTFGRIDKQLYDFYSSDIKNGTLTKEQAYELVCQFLIIWDCHYDHDMPMEGYADHELENTYTLGGCDEQGMPLYNELTKMFLVATREKKIIFPKVKCRYSKNSPEEYLNEINLSIINGTSTVLIQNDEATIPALVRAGRPLEEAREYVISGCWGMATPQEKYDHGSYLNMLKPFEYAVHASEDKIKLVEIAFETFNGSEDFEELYCKTVRNCERLLDARIDKTARGGKALSKVCTYPLFSATLENCMEKHADYTMGGGKYRDDHIVLFGLPNIIDSLMAIKTLVFDEKKLTLAQYLEAVRTNWEQNEELRILATKCHGWGDGNKDSCELAARFNNDLYAFFSKKTGSYGGRVHMGHLTYTEVRWWGERTLATPDGRKNGEYIAQGLTPLRLKRIPCVNDVINSMACLDPSVMAANSVINIILPGKIPLDRCNSFLRTIAGTAVQSLQLNCVSKEELKDAQLHPEKYPDLIVRVTGFSAKFTSLSRGWQEEVMSRNFYD